MKDKHEYDQEQTSITNLDKESIEWIYKKPKVSWRQVRASRKKEMPPVLIGRLGSNKEDIYVWSDEFELKNQKIMTDRFSFFIGRYYNEKQHIGNMFLHKPPGGRLVTILQIVFPKRIYETHFIQTIADAREDYFEALSNKDLKSARLEHMYLYGQVFKIILSLNPINKFIEFVTAWRIK